MKTGISVIIPCYNEENNLNRGVLKEVYDFLKTQKYPWEVLICNDQSTDNSLKIVQKFAKSHRGFRVLDLPKGGKNPVPFGWYSTSKIPLCLFTDMDQSTPISELNKLLPFTAKKYDILSVPAVINVLLWFITSTGLQSFFYFRKSSFKK